MNGAAAAAAARLPAAAGRAGLVRHDEREVAALGSRRSTSRSRATSRRSATGCATPRTIPATPVTRILPRALMVPPGIPDFLTRRRGSLDAGPCVLEGRAWSGCGPIERVEVSADGGGTWARRASSARAGAVRLAGLDVRRGTPARASTSCAAGRPTRTGARSRSTPAWNFDGIGNNVVQRVPGQHLVARLWTRCRRLVAKDVSTGEAARGSLERRGRTNGGRMDSGTLAAMATIVFGAAGLQGFGSHASSTASRPVSTGREHGDSGARPPGNAPRREPVSRCFPSFR